MIVASIKLNRIEKMRVILHVFIKLRIPHIYIYNNIILLTYLYDISTREKERERKRKIIVEKNYMIKMAVLRFNFLLHSSCPPSMFYPFLISLGR